jgi:hypothetical protein
MDGLVGEMTGQHRGSIGNIFSTGERLLSEQRRPRLIRVSDDSMMAASRNAASGGRTLIELVEFYSSEPCHCRATDSTVARGVVRDLNPSFLDTWPNIGAIIANMDISTSLRHETSKRFTWSAFTRVRHRCAEPWPTSLAVRRCVASC